MPGGHGSSHTIGAGSQGKGAGTGAFTELEDEAVRKEQILSNRDKAQHSDARGLDSKGIQVDEYQDTPANRHSDS
jgi:hypothetical protein